MFSTYNFERAEIIRTLWSHHHHHPSYLVDGPGWGAVLPVESLLLVCLNYTGFNKSSKDKISNDIVWIEKKTCAHVSLSLISVSMSSGDGMGIVLGNSGEEGGDVQGSVTLLSRFGATIKRRVVKNGRLGRLLGGIHANSIDIHAFVDTSITWNRSITFMCYKTSIPNTEHSVNPY